MERGHLVLRVVRTSIPAGLEDKHAPAGLGEAAGQGRPARSGIDADILGDDQGTRPIKPVHLQPFDTVRITCRHVQWLRDVLPAFESAREDRYVIWAEGSTDEMCLGMLQVAFDDD